MMTTADAFLGALTLAFGPGKGVRAAPASWYRHRGLNVTQMLTLYTAPSCICISTDGKAGCSPTRRDVTGSVRKKGSMHFHQQTFRPGAARWSAHCFFSKRRPSSSGSLLRIAAGLLKAKSCPFFFCTGFD